MNRNSRFLVEDGIVTEFQQVKQISTTAFMEAIKAEAGITTGLMPRDCIYHSRGSFVPGTDGASGIYIIEKEPKAVNFTYKHAGRGASTKQETLRLSLPFVIFFIQTRGDLIGNIYPACTKQKITSLEDKIFVLPLTNIFAGGNGNLCTGSMRAPKDAPLHVRLMSTVKAFYESEFNLDLVPNETPAIFVDDNGDRGMRGWAKASAENPFVGIADTTSYTQHSKRTVGGMIEMMNGNGG